MRLGKTVFVVGAGASKELGLPVGYDLKKEIQKIVDIRFDDFGSNLKSGDYKYVETLRFLSKEKNPTSPDINPYLHAGWKIRDNMSLAPSIDNFMETHKDNEHLIDFGKIAIASAIQKGERGSKLFVDEVGGRDRLDFSSLEVCWLHKLFQILVEGRSFEKFVDALSGITFISFNYDRCIRHFLFVAARSYFSVNDAEIFPVVQGLNIIHPYGSLGELKPFSDSRSGYGALQYHHNLIETSRNIRTFTEGGDDKFLSAGINIAIREASSVVFLGFAFHPMNLDLLFDGVDEFSADVVASAFGLSESNVKKIVEDLEARSRGQMNSILMEKKTCVDLINDNWRFFSYD